MKIELLSPSHASKTDSNQFNVELSRTDYARLITAIRRRLKRDGDTLEKALKNFSETPGDDPLELIPKAYADVLHKAISDALAAHEKASYVHNATNSAKGGLIIIRDPQGRAEVTDPQNPLDIVNFQTLKNTESSVLDQLLDHILDSSNPHPNASSCNGDANMLMLRDNLGRCSVKDADLEIPDHVINTNTLLTVVASKIKEHNNNYSVHGATPEAAGNRIIIRDENGRAKVSNPEGDSDIANYGTVKLVSKALDDHANSKDPHPKASSELVVGSSLVKRTEDGRIKAAAPKEDNDVVTVKFFQTSGDELISDHAKKTNVHGATSKVEPNRLVIRDASGRSQVADPVDKLDIVNLQTLSKVGKELHEHMDNGENPHPEASSYENEARKLPIRNDLGNIQVGTASSDLDAVNLSVLKQKSANILNNVSVINPQSGIKSGDLRIVGGRAYLNIEGTFRQIWPATYK